MDVQVADVRINSWRIILYSCIIHYTVSQKNWATFFTAYNFRNIEQSFTKLGTNHVLFILNIKS